jgi:exosortase K
LALGFGAKAFYSHAGPDELLWILAPSSWLARVAGGVDLRYEAGGGFISHADHLVVGTACAGVNFLIVAFLTLFFAFGARFAGTRAKLGWLLASAGLAYVATIVTNGLRIAVSARLFAADIYGGALTPERLHRLAGTVLYYGSLLGLCLSVGAALKAPCRRWVPLVWYALISVGVPLAGRAWTGDAARFAEHVAWTLGIACLLTAIALVPALLRDRIQWKM